MDRKLTNIILLTCCVGIYVAFERLNADVVESASITFPLDSKTSQIRATPKSSRVKDVESTNMSLSLDDKFPLAKYEKMTEQEILIDLAKLSRLEGINRTDLILKLIEEGILEVNTPMREGERSEHYIPLYAALILDADISAQQVRQFFELGTDISLSPPGAWVRKTANIRDIEVVKVLLENNAVAKDYGRGLIGSAALSHNAHLINYLVSDEQELLVINLQPSDSQEMLDFTVKGQRKLVEQFARKKSLMNEQELERSKIRFTRGRDTLIAIKDIPHISEEDRAMLDREADILLKKLSGD